MTVMELKKYIFENEKIEYILKDLGCWKIQYHEIKNYYTACHADGDNPMGIVINNNEYLRYISYSRNVTYEDNKDLISLVEEYKQFSFAEAIKYLHKLFGLKYTWKKNQTIPTKRVNPSYIFEKYDVRKRIDVNEIHTIAEDELDVYVPLLFIDWLKEGIWFDTAKKFGIAYSYRKKRIIIPIRYWLTGELVGINARTTVKDYNEFGIKKYFITPSYKKSLNLYGLWENYKGITEKKTITIFESEKSVLKRDTLLDDTCVAIQGKTISQEQVSIIKGLGVNEVIVALDNDVDIREIRWICEQFWLNIPTYYIKDKHNLLGAKDSPIDKGKKIYDFLFKYKIKYDENEHNKLMKELKR